MTHCVILVAVPNGTSEEIENAVAHEMAPYDENGEWFRDGSRWDWWVIGGRFVGWLSEYEPRKDPRNHEQCDLCGGTGTRRDAIARANNFKEGYCNGCSHEKDITGREGWRVKWPSSWVPYDGDVMPAAQVKAISRKIAASAFLRSRHWHEGDRAGWWGGTAATEDEIRDAPTEARLKFRHDDGTEALITTYKESRDDWNARFSERFLANLPDDHVVVVVDYHV